MPVTPGRRAAVIRVGVAGAAALALVAGAFALPSAEESRNGSYRATTTGAPGGVAEEAAADHSPTLPELPDDGHAHDHDDPATKNLISRAGTATERTADPTTADEAADAAEYVARDRRSPDPELRELSPESPRTEVPEDRFALAGGCYALRAPDGGWLRRGDSGLVADGERVEDAEPFHLRATDLGSYLLYGTEEDFVSARRDGVTLAGRPSPRADWQVEGPGRTLRFTSVSGAGLAVEEEAVTTGAATPLEPRLTEGCRDYPEVEVNVTGGPHAGTTPYQEVRGFIDPHTHGMAFEFLGGRVHCGRPWHRYGAAYALVDCADHRLTLGKGAALEAVLSGEPSHDPVGWPTFVDWPAPNSLTHEGTYHRWMERSWRGGQRILTNLLTENGQLCKIYPLKKNSCDDMDSIRLQAKRMREFERYVDAQHGGPGQGWYRIVTSPWEARRVINEGKLAVVMGIETSVPFGCTFKTVPLRGDVPECDRAAIDAQLQEMWDLGVRQMELVNKFDNALAGVAGDAGEVGVAVNAANFLETGTFWAMQHCEPEDGESADKTQLAAPDISSGQQDALFGAVAELGLNLPAVPVYPPPQHCNRRGLTDLGSFLVDRMADRGMLIDPDHMSVKARQATLTRLEQRDYPGVVSSHSWSTPDAYPRIYRLGGFVAPYAGDSEGFLAKWQRHLGWADERYFFGFGYGADINGLGAQGDPRGEDVPDPVEYPFEGFGGTVVDQQVSGERVYDINVDGVAHYGLYPDWIEDLRRLGGEEHGDAIVTDLSRGPEAFLQTWERAQGIAPDPCRNPDLRRSTGDFRAAVRDLVRHGADAQQVLVELGQPWSRVGTEFTYCATGGGDREVRLVVELDEDGTARRVRRA